MTINVFLTALGICEKLADKVLGAGRGCGIN